MKNALGFCFLTLTTFTLLGSMAVVNQETVVAQAQPAKQTDLDKEAAAVKAQKDALQAQLDAIQAKKKLADPTTLKTGARRTPVHKIIEALRTGKATVFTSVKAPPASVAMVPPKLTYLGNNQFGCCVTSESCFSIEAYSVGIGLPEIIITDQEAISWATSHGVRDGADLLQVIQMMQQDGIKDSTGKLYKSGSPSTVDYSNESILQAAIALGPISIAIDANALPGGAGNNSGWSAFNGGRQPNTDHCVSICGYGSADLMAKALGVPVPANAPATTLYLVYTWSTIGMVDHAWIMDTVVEGWLRTPTVLGLTPTPQPSPVTVAVGDVTGTVGVPTTFFPLASGGTGPYQFAYTYGDGGKDATGVHTYSAAGSFYVNVTVTDAKGQQGLGTCMATVTSVPTPIPTPGIATLTLSEIDGSRRTFVESDNTGTVVIIGGVRYTAAPARPRLTPEQLNVLRQILEQMGTPPVKGK